MRALALVAFFAAFLGVCLANLEHVAQFLSKRAILLDDNFVPLVRERRDTGYPAPHKGGHDWLGPVFTFAKTDYHGNFKWGVRHKAAHSRQRRSYGGPVWVNTFAMTDHHGNFKWGVRHNVGHGGH